MAPSLLGKLGEVRAAFGGEEWGQKGSHFVT
jgi:hypothetical protein